MEVRTGNGRYVTPTREKPESRTPPPVVVSRFDPATGRHISGPVADTERYALKARRAKAATAAERDAAHAEAVEQARAIEEAMSKRKKSAKAQKARDARSRARGGAAQAKRLGVRVEVDGRVYPTMKAGAESIGVTLSKLQYALVSGKDECNGHKVRRIGRG